MSEARFRAAGLLGHALVTGLFATVRFRAEGEESFLRYRRQGRPVIFVLWHSHLLPLTWQHRDTGVVSLLSEHADGEYLARVMKRIGLGAVRGSSTRGGVRGLKGLIRAAREGHDIALTADGPRGPARVFKLGALAAAQATGLPLVPLAAAASSAWQAGSWDRMIVPRPLATVRIAYGPPMHVGREAGREELIRLAQAMAAELDRLEAVCAAALGRPPVCRAGPAL